MNRIQLIFDASYEIGRAAAIATMGGNGGTILADGARKLSLIDRPALKSAAAELSAIVGNWNAQSSLVSGIFHSRVQKADNAGPLFHAASCAYQLGTMREYCQHEVTDLTAGQIADGIKTAKAHAGALCDLQCSTFNKRNAQQKFGALVDRGLDQPLHLVELHLAD